MLFLVGLFLVAAFGCLLIGAFSRSARKQRRFITLCAILMVPSLILSSVIFLTSGA
ncbi:hypothetical protein H9L12_04745 [Sphingomonas rhizophila]|uniref:Uncharacterized protein n=1 Tax=Sphingomonas rhizophila TaxID=2071607 RepID=A0A7G9SDC3_9SPHN|nr:hypothetical protein [Sphingomonas rhizophila]QNN65848.1 hypothetical protein H9L12_04745 [Sphingomonas rhizophila]